MCKPGPKVRPIEKRFRPLPNRIREQAKRARANQCSFEANFVKSQNTLPHDTVFFAIPFWSWSRFFPIPRTHYFGLFEKIWKIIWFRWILVEFNLFEASLLGLPKKCVLDLAPIIGWKIYYIWGPNGEDALPRSLVHAPFLSRFETQPEPNGP